MNIIKEISQRLSISENAVETVVKLLDEGSTIPFISRYRKEVTGSLNEIAIFDISTLLEKFRSLEKRKNTIIAEIESQNKMTTELHQRIELVTDANELEDIYLPFKPKRRTKAEIAREHGLEPLAKIIMSQKPSDIPRQAARFTSDDIASTDDAINGASNIIAEWISESERNRNIVRNKFAREALISSSVVKGKESDGEKYAQYFDFSEPLKKCSSHRYLAIRRAEKDGVLRVGLKVDDNSVINRIADLTIRKDCPQENADIIFNAIADGYKRLIRPTIETESASSAKEKADEVAINAFAENVEQLLMAPPLGAKRVLAIDPGFRTGCKIVCLDEQGNILYNDVIYPTAPKNDINGSVRKLSRLVESYRIDAIALGNGTASRETEQFLKSMRFPHAVEIYVVNENGASVYSASKIAREEFPDKDVTVRGAVSIGRRLIDPLSELVKIDPKSIGVGQYQHDVDQNRLKESLNFVVENCVNKVGVNVNTASSCLLAYVSGIGPTLAENIIKYRTENGDFKSRAELKKVPRLGEKAFEQSAGFLRIPGADNPLDNSAVHPERYALVQQLASDLGVSSGDLIGNDELVNRIDLKKYVSENVGMPTLTDIIAELHKPGRDPRKKVEIFEFDSSIRSIDDLKPGMILNGIVNNITEFGAFVDLGIHQSGLIHISQMSDRRISSPREVVKLNQHLKVRVLEVDKQRNRIALSLKNM